MSPIDSSKPGDLVRWYLKYGAKRKNTNYDFLLITGYLLGDGDEVTVPNDKGEITLSRKRDGADALYEVIVSEMKKDKEGKDVSTPATVVFSALLTSKEVTFSKADKGWWQKELHEWYDAAREAMKAVTDEVPA